MDEHKQAVPQKRIEKTMKALERNKMKPFYAKDKGEALRIVQSLLQPGQTITCGGSVTLSECGIIDLLRSGQYHYLDRDRPDLTPNVCAVYVEEAHRCRGIAGQMLRFVCADMKNMGIDTLYLVTDHTSFYERYGWEFLCMVQDSAEGTPIRMYVHRG